MASTAKKKTRTDERKRPRLVHGKHVDEGMVQQAFDESRALRIVAVVAVGLLFSYVLMEFFEPALKYKMSDRLPPIASPEFQRTVEALADARLTRDNRIEVFPNGENFYSAEVDAMRQARRSIDLEAYIWHDGDLTRLVRDALIERAKAGVKIRMVVDGAGNPGIGKKWFKPLSDAGGEVAFYHPMSWKTWWRYNNRTHRELLVIDGAIGFVGGAGYDDQWILATKKEPRWRDNMFRVSGDAVADIQGTFVENWLEASGEVLSGGEYFQADGPKGHAAAMVVNGTPSAGRSTRSRVLYGTLLAAAEKSVHIATPYFLPDATMIHELLDARKRGVEVTILVPNGHNDHAVTRASSRSYYGELLKGGIRIYEYQPAMLHEKVMVVDGLWSVVGSSNLDSRSFQLNDEVNLAVMDEELAARLNQLYADDLHNAREVTYEAWRKRPLWERPLGWVGWLMERQQ